MPARCSRAPGLEVDAVEPQYWFPGRQLKLVRVLGRTPLAPFLAGQYVLRGRSAGDRCRRVLVIAQDRLDGQVGGTEHPCARARRACWREHPT